MFFDMFKPEDFYRNFDTDYFLFAQEINRANLDNRELFESIQKKFPWVEEKSYRLSILMQIRFQTLLCINTLFELIFNLLPDEKGYIPDKELILRMNMFKELKPSEIANWVNGKVSKLDQLQKPIEYKNGEVKELAYHLFYVGKAKSQDVDESIIHLLEMLKIMGKEIAETSEINSFKHGMRGVVDQKFFSILNKETKLDLLKFDFSEAISFYSYDKNENCFTMNIKSLDLERNENLTVIASLLMKAIINPRKKIFHQNEKKEEIINVLITEDLVQKLSSSSLGHFSLRFSNCKEKS